MTKTRSRAIGIGGLMMLAGFALGAPPASAQQFPERAVRLVVPQTPGGATDVLARAIGQRLSERWGQPVVVDNRGGAGGIIGTDAVAKAPPDGYTLLVTYVGSQAVNQSLYQTLPFDSVKDFQTVVTIAVVPFFLVVGASSPAHSLTDFIALARQKPNQITYASSGNGSINHLLGEMLSSETGIRLVHVPYKGVAPALTDLIGGQVDAAFASVPSVIQHIRSGAVRALAISSLHRSPAAQDVPTIAETAVPGFDVNPWWGILAPAGTKAPIVRRINQDVAAILATDAMRVFLETQGGDVLITTPEEFRVRLEADVATWAKVVKQSGAHID
jgi:tripartite-type tricarboxylate transporter receptor subunit TctC